MKCIGRDCVYNKCNAGNYCGLLSSCYTQEGNNCVIDEEIEIAYEAYIGAKECYERLLSEKIKIDGWRNADEM